MTLSRRRFVQGAGVAGLGLLGGCGRWPGQAQGPGRVPRIGWLNSSSTTYDAAFRDGLLAHGYVDGQNIIVEWRRGDSEDQLPALASELVQHNVDVIVATGQVEQIREAASTIPIVMAIGNDPEDRGLVASLSRPGGNVTGLSNLLSQLTAKRLQILKDAVPSITRVGVLWNPSTTVQSSWRELPASAQALGVTLQSLEVGELEDFERLLHVVAREQTDGLLLLGGPFYSRHNAKFVQFGVQSQLPSMAVQRGNVIDGCLMAYGADFAAMVRRSAVYVDKILKGAKPADLPVEQPREFDFVINLKIAQALGLTIPPHVLLQATEVIQ
jgi:putative tryptophan/tyrosine transport system substrate-binding protein